MVTAVAAIGALLLSVAIMVMGNGLQGTLITVRANIEAFNAAEIGLLVSGYYAGFIAGCWVAPHMVVRVGHIRTFAALSVVAAGTILIYPIVVEPWVWWVMRAIAGFALAGLYTVIESWLNDRATNENRGALFSIYRAVDLSAMTAGLMLLNLATPEGFELFSIAALLMSLALVPVAMTRAVAPAPVAAAHLQLRRLYRASPLGVVGVFLVAMANAASMGLIPVFVQRSGFGVEAVAFAMAALVVGGALAQYPVGWLSDKFDRRSIVIVFTILAVVGGAGVAGVSVYSGGFALIVAATAVFGAITMPLYSLLVSHVNDHLEPHEFVVASGGLLLIYGLGAVVGPVIASFVMLDRPPWLLFAYTSTVFGVLVAYSLWRVTRRAPVPAAEQGDFVMPLSPLMTPQAFELDPRADADAVAEADLMEPVAEAPLVTEITGPTSLATPEPEAPKADDEGKDRPAPPADHVPPRPPSAGSGQEPPKQP